jgi:hypothetical protein
MQKGAVTLGLVCLAATRTSIGCCTVSGLAPFGTSSASFFLDPVSGTLAREVVVAGPATKSVQIAVRSHIGLARAAASNAGQAEPPPKVLSLPPTIDTPPGALRHLWGYWPTSHR